MHKEKIKFIFFKSFVTDIQLLPYSILFFMLFQAAGKFEIPLVVEQLKYCGIVETIKIRKAGYPIRYVYADFIKR